MSTSFNNTKIIATVGPATNTKEKLLELIVAGVDVFRLNFSHGSHEDHKKVIEHIRDLNKTLNYNISILQDLQGPKIRIGEMEGGGVMINEGDEIVITNEKVVGNAQKVSTTYTNITKDVKAGDSILVDDGKIELKVFSVEPNGVHTRVVYGGILKSKKGMNLPDTDISEGSLTKKDKADLLFGLENEVDWIAISFVRSGADIIGLRSIINEHNSKAKTIAKIERPEAIRDLDQIVEQADALMVARGDLGVEINMEDVPMQQKRIVKKCKLAAKPVIIATQMMESMMENPRPTRAEANDVANAVFDGADAVMLSGETAAGKFPVETIQAMDKIIASVESNDEIYHQYFPFDKKADTFRSDIIVEAAVRMSEIADAKAIIGTTSSGFTAFHLSKHRPKADLFIFTSNKDLLKTLNLVWGVRAFYYKKVDSTDATFKMFEVELIKRGHLRKGDTYINTASIPLKAGKTTNMVKLNQVENV